MRRYLEVIGNRHLDIINFANTGIPYSLPNLDPMIADIHASNPSNGPFPFDLTTGDWTIEFWLRRAAAGFFNVGWQIGDAGMLNTRCRFGTTASTNNQSQFTYYQSDGTSTYMSVTGPTSQPGSDVQALIHILIPDGGSPQLWIQNVNQSTTVVARTGTPMPANTSVQRFFLRGGITSSSYGIGKPALYNRLLNSTERGAHISNMTAL